MTRFILLLIILSAVIVTALGFTIGRRSMQQLPLENGGHSSEPLPSTISNPIPTQIATPKSVPGSMPASSPTSQSGEFVPYTKERPRITSDLLSCIEKWKSLEKSTNQQVRPERVFIVFAEDTTRDEMKAILQFYKFNIGSLFGSLEKEGSAEGIIIMVHVPQGLEIEWACALEREDKILSAQPEIPTPPPSLR